MTATVRRTAALATTLGTALALLLSLGATSAHAERLAFTDRKGDVWSLDIEEMFNGEYESFSDLPFRAEPRVANGDITRTVVSHRRHNVVVHVDFAELRRVGEFRGDFMRFRTDTGARRTVMLFAGMGHWRGEMEVLRAGMRPVDCRSSHRIDYDANTVEIRLSRKCLGDPRWIQMRAESGWARLQDNRVYGDNAHNRSPVNYQFTQRLYAD